MWTYGTSFIGWRLVQGIGFCWLVMPPEPSPLATILADIQKALDSKLYYLALAVALSIPDICASLECEPGKIWTNQQKYENWVERHLEPFFKKFTAKDCYRLRCGVLHRGNFGRPDDRYDRIVFLPPNALDYRIHEVHLTNNGDSQEKIICFDIIIFCNNIIRAANLWLAAMSDDKNVAANMPELVRLRPNGIPPSIVGMPLIG